MTLSFAESSIKNNAYYTIFPRVCLLAKKNLPCKEGKGINHGSYKKYAHFEPFLEACRAGFVF